MYLNDKLDDCVMAARAHHTLRLAWDGVHALPAISNDDVSREYFKETDGPDDGLDLQESLDEWKKIGWTIGRDRTMRKINGYSGPYSVNGDAIADGNPSMELSQQQLKAIIFSSIGAEIILSLPEGISVTNKNSFGPGHPWHDTSGSEWESHVMLLTGYDKDGFLGITWAQRQKMTWEFLKTYCYGVFFVEKSETT